METLIWNLCLYNSITDSIRKPIPAGQILFCNHVTALVLSQFILTIRPRHNTEKHTTPTMAASNSKYAIGSSLRGIPKLTLSLHSIKKSWKRTKSRGFFYGAGISGAQSPRNPALKLWSIISLSAISAKNTSLTAISLGERKGGKYLNICD